MASVKPTNPIIDWGNPITKGLVFDMPLFEGSGLPRDIYSRKVGSLVNAPTWTNGLLGHSMTFATNKAVNFTNASLGTQLSTSLGRTCEVWFKSNGAQNLPANLVKKDNAFILRINDTNNFRWIPFGGGSIIVGYSGITYTTGVWFHMVGTQKPGSQILYLQGLQVASATNANAPDNSTNSMGIGASPDGSEPFNGEIAVTRYWNRSLLANEVKQLYVDPWCIYQKPRFRMGYQTASSSIKKFSSIAQASIKKVSGITLANIKKISGVAD